MATQGPYISENWSIRSVRARFVQDLFGNMFFWRGHTIMFRIWSACAYVCCFCFDRALIEHSHACQAGSSTVEHWLHPFRRVSLSIACDILFSLPLHGGRGLSMFPRGGGRICPALCAFSAWLRQEAPWHQGSGPLAPEISSQGRAQVRASTSWAVGCPDRQPCDDEAKREH